MHEWALAESILTAAVEAAEKEKFKKISEIIVEIGELQQIAMDAFEFALNEIITEQAGILEGVKINFKTEDANLVCNNCGHEWSFKDMKKTIDEDQGESIHFIPEVAFVHSRCPKCKSPDFEISKGRGVSILSIKGEK
jgi:hydrogenase nickel incorporation protein HypA/HybF